MMMIDAMDSTAPVTRGELRAQLDAFEDRLDQRFAVIDQRFAGIDQRFAGIDQRFDRLDQRFAVIDQRFAGIDQRLAGIATKADLEIWGGALLAEIGRHFKAIQEALSTQISVIDDKYQDLPRRVAHLEATLLPRKRR